MDEQITIAAENEQQLKNEMLFTLSQRVSGTLTTIVTGNEKQQKELQSFLKEHLKEYQFYNLDLTPHSYTSLHKALTELLPAHIQKAGPAEWLINITGLENNVYKSENGKIEFSSLLPQLNFERELLFNQPHILALWISKSFDNELRKKAPDLMHWLSKRFVFAGENMSLAMAEEVLDKGLVNQQGRIPKRTERIIELEAAWERLCMDDADKERLIKDKINILILLGKEYREAFDFIESVDALKKALSLSEKIELKNSGEIAYNLGKTYLQFNKFNEALLYFQQSLKLEQERRYENSFGAIYHVIGMVYEEQRKWPEALDNYQKAIDWYTKTGNEFTLGSTYHHIGRVHEKQRKWPEALDNYKKAIDWNTKTGNEFELGGTYHQIGMVHEEQWKWHEALDNYQKAIDWKTKTENEFALGGTYHQIGMVYEEQRKWPEALDNYKKAIDWNTKTGNEFGLGNTYHNKGMVYEKQRKWPEALDNYQKAIDWDTITGNEFGLGGTYLQLGRVYEEQRKWPEALDNYQKAIDLNTKTENEFELGVTYHQIGSFYAGQSKWIEALENYQKAIDWDIKTGNEFELGGTYHLIGRVYEEQGEFEKAKEFYLLAKANQEKFDLPYFETINESIKRIDQKINSAN